jgi:hypothetical protein
VRRMGDLRLTFALLRMDERGCREVRYKAHQQQRRSNVTCDAARETVIFDDPRAVIRRRVELRGRGLEGFGVDRCDRRNDGCEKQDGERGPDVTSHEGQFYIRWVDYSGRFRSARGSLPGAAPYPVRMSKPVGRSEALHPPPSASTSRTLAVIRRVRLSTAARSLASAAL